MSQADNVGRYWRKLLGIEKHMTFCQTQIERNKIWKEQHDYFMEHIRLGSPKLQELGLARNEIIILGLVLIHPKFSKDSEGDCFREQLDQSRNMTVLDEEKRHGQCQIHFLENTNKCIYIEFPEFREGVFVGDHVWPYSLGGPTNSRVNLNLNRLILCKACNEAKSNSIYSFDFNTTPDWLVERVHAIAVKKQVL